MSTPEFLQLGGRPASPATTSWFEFLLQPQLLVKHLENRYAIPGAHQLIVQFLQQANTLEAADSGTEVKQPEIESNGHVDESGEKTDDVKEETKYHKKKSYALKILALKIASYLQWDLKSLMSEVPGPLVLQLLNELLKLCKVEGNDEVLIESLKQDSHPDHVFFALLLYQRWCLHTVLQDCMPKKPMKVNSIFVPGLTEPVIKMETINEEKLIQIKKLFGKCKVVLNESLNMNRKACMPTHHCFQFNGSAMAEFKMDWDKGKQLQSQQWCSQVAFDLGSVYFYETDYYKALDMFAKVESWLSQDNSIEKVLFDDKLTGYLKACRVIVNKVQHQDNVIVEFDSAINSKDIKLLNSLLKANVSKNQLPPTAADQVALLIQELRKDNSNISEDLIKLECQVSFMYMIRGDPAYISPDILEKSVSHWTEILSHTMQLVTVEQKEKIEAIIEYLVSMDDFFKPLLALKAVNKPADDKNTSMETEQTCTESLLKEEAYDLDECSLVLCYDADKIWAHLCSIHATSNLKPIVDFWRLPKDIDKLFSELTVELNTVCAYVLIVKAKELITIREYDHAVVLLNAAEKTVRERSNKIAKIVRWEILYCHLLSTKIKNENVVADLDNQVKACLHSMKIDSDIYPHDGLVMECVAFLLLSKEWEYLSSLHDTRVAYTEYARQLINVCKMLPCIDQASAPGKVLWDTTVVMLYVQNSGKRVRLGNKAMLPKDTYKKFLLTIKEPLVLSVLISLLTRVYNLKNTNTDIDRSNTFSPLWPDSLSPNVLASIDEIFVQETLIELVQHALSINSMESSWLKTYAEIQFGIGNMKDAIKYYLKSASVASNHFLSQVPPYVFGPEVYTRLIKCCASLKNFTQAAILCQFLPEPDYPAAFKYLLEKNCQDGMDIYYDCLWDVNILEFLVNMHTKQGEIEKKQMVIQLLGNPEINSNNPDVILQTVQARKNSQFLRKLAQQYV